AVGQARHPPQPALYGGFRGARPPPPGEPGGVAGDPDRHRLFYRPPAPPPPPPPGETPPVRGGASRAERPPCPAGPPPASTSLPAPRRATRAADRMPMAACSRAWAGLCSSGPPRHTASHERPFEMTSRLAHWWASITGWRWTNVAMQPTPRRIRPVTPARAERSATDSRRGLAGR